MEVKTFLITGYGRSGTKYLSTVLDSIGNYTVKHEPRGNVDELYRNNLMTIHSIKRDFRNHLYGEVNSYLRYHIDIVPAYKKALVLRNPLDIYLSVCNRKPDGKHDFYMNDIIKWYNQFIELIDKRPEIGVFKFEEFIGNKEKMIEIAEWCRIRVENPDIDYKAKINPNKTVKYKSLGDLPKASLKGLDRLMEITDIYNGINSN